jgi:predicted ATPase/DNA-binding winged helix-turn-helix (wHTH) protein
MLGEYRFGSMEVRPAARQLLINGAPAALGARAFDLLMALIERRERVVNKAELFDAVWPGLVVEENNLQVQVNSLRKLLGPKAIATVPGRGYQFVAELDPSASKNGSAIREIATNPNNLPRLRTRFIGREKALDDCAGLLHDARLLTLSGIGGCGKTRLAQELAQRQLAAFPDGVWFVDLGPLQDAERVPAAVAATLGIKGSAAAPLERVAEHLKSRHTLVVLDNCEHVIDAAVESVDALLGNCSALKIVATSREALGMKGEQIFMVRSLSLPATTDLDEMLRSEAVRLFVDHARLVLPDFAVDERNAAAVAEICRRLDGIALAIELAAVRVKVLSVDEIRARLDDRFRLLTGGNRAMPRHQTLHATMQWSHDLLTAPERRQFRRLAVFAGGCTLAAAAAVSGDSTDEYDALERLTALHDKSLLMVDRDTQAQPRYRMLETVRQYAEERLNEAGEGDEVRTRHLLHYVALGERAAPELTGPRQGDWFDALWCEQENLLAAHAWCAHAAQGGELALRLTQSLWRYWAATSQVAAGYRLAQEALDLAAADRDSTERGWALMAKSYFACRRGAYDVALSCAERSLAIGRAQNNAALIAGALRAVASALHTTNQAARALAALAEACDVARAINDAAELSAVLDCMGAVHQDEGRLAEAKALHEQAFAMAREHGNVRRCAIALGNLAGVLLASGELDRARAALAESMALSRTQGGKGAVECQVDIVAALASASASHAAAARFHGAVTARMRESGTHHEPAYGAFISDWMARSREAIGAAAFDAAEAEGKALNYEAALAEMERWLCASECKSWYSPR